MADLPNGIDIHTARVAVAWEMAKLAMQRSYEFGNSVDEARRIEMLVQAYVNAYEGILKSEPH